MPRSLTLLIAPEDRIPQGRSRVGRKPSIGGSRLGSVAWPIPPGGLSGPAGPWVTCPGCVACSMAIWLRRRLAAGCTGVPELLRVFAAAIAAPAGIPPHGGAQVDCASRG